MIIMVVFVSKPTAIYCVFYVCNSKVQGSTRSTPWHIYGGPKMVQWYSGGTHFMKLYMISATYC